MPFNQNTPADPAVHNAAVRGAYRCRRIIQCVLREEEWRDADWEFYCIIRDELEALLGDGNATAANDRDRTNGSASRFDL